MPLRAITLVLMLIALPAVAAAGDSRLQLPNFDSLERKASDSVNLTLGPSVIHFASLFMDANNSEDADAKKLLAGIDSIQIHHFEFDAENAYSTADVEAIRNQLQAPEWHKIVQSHDRKTQDNVDIYARVVADHPAGFAILVTEPKEFTIVDISGSIDAAALGSLGGHLGIPKVDSKPAH